MRRRLIGVLMLSGALLMLNSCKDDPTPISGISFEKTEEEVTESDGTTKSFNPLVISAGTGVDVKVKLLLDKAAPDNIVLSYTVAGTTDRSINSTTGGLNDFNLNGANAKSSETLIIEKGATEAIITLTVYEDNSFEVDDDDNLFETVILTLDKVVSGPAVIAETNTAYTLKINEDDALVVLQWDATPETTSVDAGDVDMDLFIWLNGDIVKYSAFKDNDFEGTFIPAGFPDGSYGVSYTYYGGSSNNLKFGSYMFGRSLSNKPYLYPKDNPLIFAGTYTKANINAYDLNAELPATQIVQTIVKTKLNFAPSAITIPASGSRVNASGKANSFDSNFKLRMQSDNKPVPFK